VQEYLALEGGPPSFSQGSTSPDLLDRRRLPDTYGTVTFCGRPFQIVRLSLQRRMARSHGLIPLSLAATYGVSVDFLSSGY
jgi:hypothetical protein